jgi:hypothetical protein
MFTYPVSHAEVDRRPEIASSRARGKEGLNVKIGFLLAGLMLWVAGCSTTVTSNPTLAGQFALSASTGVFR